MKIQPTLRVQVSKSVACPSDADVSANTQLLASNGGQANSPKRDKCTIVGCVAWAEDDESSNSLFRTINLGNPGQGNKFPPNDVKTSIYTPLSFLPKNLFKQFSRFSNVYFLFITALQLIPQVTSTPGFPTMVIPLIFIIVVSAARDLVEDLDRHKSDNLQNQARVAKLDLRSMQLGDNCDLVDFTTSVCADLHVGDLVRVAQNEEVPADVALIATSHSRGHCFVMTANLDGESTFKPRYVPPELCISPYGGQCFASDGQLILGTVDRVKALTIDCEPPNRHIDRFEGSIRLSSTSASDGIVDLDINNVLLKGTHLKDTQWAIGVVVYTGDDTRVRQNSSDTPIKQSWLYRFINKITLWVVLAQIAILLVAVVVQNNMVSSKSVVENPYIDDDIKDADTLDLVYLFLAYMLLFSNFVPISLQVTIDFTRYIQAKVIQSDPEMHCRQSSRTEAALSPRGGSPSTKQSSVRVQSSELNEELGLVEHVFSDKTGTLTCNRMEFRSCHVDGKTFDFDEERGSLNQIVEDFRMVTMTNISTSNGPRSSDTLSQEPVPEYTSLSSFGSESSTRSPQMLQFLLNLAVNNSISPSGLKEPVDGGPHAEQHNRAIELSGPSPDEKALVAAAARLGVSLRRRDNAHVAVCVDKEDLDLQILQLFEFTSDRKKSSIVCRHPDGRIILYCKGADTVILRDLSGSNHADKLQQARDQMQVYSSNGLRVLCIAQRELSEDEYTAWNSRFLKQRSALKKKSKACRSDISTSEPESGDAMVSIISELECDLTLVGISAIEDKIQDGAPETLEKFREAGIKVWMLTGDRPDTATNVAYAVRLISSEMRLIKLTESHWLESKTTALHFFERELERSQGDAYTATGSFLLPKALPRRLHYKGCSTKKHSVCGPRLAMVVDNTAIEAIHEFGLERQFLQLCMLCESVLCARISPKQKEFIVGMVRSQCPEKITMAIGDGANDVPMIQRAHIGVGIAGEEGNQASDASDYSIPAFRFLQKLVLVHGRAMNRRIAVLTLYIFYKNVLLVLPQFVYGIYCLFSGQSSYYDPLLQLFNICFTSLPVLYFSVFDQDISAATLLRYPQLYQDGSLHTFLNIRVFIYWMFEATVASILIILVPAMLIPLVPWSGEGKDNDLWSLGLTHNFVVVFLANARLLLEVSMNQRMMFSLTAASVLCWWAVVSVMSSSVSFGREFYSILRVGSLTQLVLCTAFCATLSLSIALLPRVYEVMFAPKPRTIGRELDYTTESKNGQCCSPKRKITGTRGEGESRTVVVPR